MGSPESDCPRCAALTRERDEARANLRKFAAKDIALARDLAQARQALQRLSWAATTVWHQASVGSGQVELVALDEILEANAVAREALAERGEE